MGDKKKNNVEQKYEKITIKDYKFTIILLSIIAIFTFASPFIFKGVTKLKDMDIIGNIFSKNKPNEPIQSDTGNKDDNNEKNINSDKSGASVPILKEGMIPVRYNYIEKKWVKANSKNPSTNNWYNYDNKEWANAILVKENGNKSRDYYINATPDTVIDNEDILAFYVWIPRYKYSLISNTGMQQIDIVFESKTTNKSTGPNYITHPAFTSNGEELDGLWVGKFEITGNINNLTILPGVAPVLNQNIASMYNSVKAMYGNYYGLNASDSNLHLMKNTEWGAVVYLTNSKYGLCKNDSCKKMSSYTNDYSSDIGVNASTTLNINGIYAMNGSVMEYVMGNNSGNIGLSGFDINWMNENKNYYDLYTDGDAGNYSRGINGDATKEFGPFENNASNWDNSFSVFVNSENPWFIRDINGSMYSFSNYTGDAHYQVGFRLSLN